MIINIIGKKITVLKTLQIMRLTFCINYNMYEAFDNILREFLRVPLGTIK